MPLVTLCPLSLAALVPQYGAEQTYVTTMMPAALPSILVALVVPFKFRVVAHSVNLIYSSSS